jgi:hypothetical protein
MDQQLTGTARVRSGSTRVRSGSTRVRSNTLPPLTAPFAASGEVYEEGLTVPPRRYPQALVLTVGDDKAQAMPGRFHQLDML